VFAGITLNEEWKDTTIKTPRQAFLAGLSCGLKSPTGRGPRFALVHAGNEHGFVSKAKFVFLYKKNHACTHEGMDGEMYEKYFSEQLLTNLLPIWLLLSTMRPTTILKRRTSNKVMAERPD
jgi:hypothetical protein